MNEATVSTLQLRAIGRELGVVWADGAVAQLPYRVLRENCPCAACRQRRRVAGPFEASDEIAITAIVPRGANAVQFAFSDGHERGIFPFSFLRELHDAAIDRSTGGGISK